MALQPVEAVLLGAGGRGLGTFGGYAERHPHDLKFVAVAEPDAERRARFAEIHKIPANRCYESAEQLLGQEQLAPALFNATMDRTHFATTMAALQKGYHVLLEKPMATDPLECVRLVEAAEAAGRVLQVGHTLRYSPFFRTLKEIVAGGLAGEIITVQHNENVAFWHMAHSFVRGNWANSKRSSPMILAKCCHDLDILRWILDRPPVRVASFGSLRHFTRERMPQGAPPRCTDGCPHEADCPYFAPRIYIEPGLGWLSAGQKLGDTPEAKREALASSPLGKCVYQTDNDVVDHQVIIMEFEGDLTVTFTMHGHSHENVRTMRYSGTRATIRGHEGLRTIEVHHYTSGKYERIEPGRAIGGHGGGDPAMIRAFVEAVRADDPGRVVASAAESLDSHLLAFAAERSRLEGVVVDFQAYKAQMQQEARAAAATR